MDAPGLVAGGRSPRRRKETEMSQEMDDGKMLLTVAETLPRWIVKREQEALARPGVSRRQAGRLQKLRHFDGGSR